MLWTKCSKTIRSYIPLWPRNPVPRSLFTSLNVRVSPYNNVMYSLTAHASGLLLNQRQSSFRDLFSFSYGKFYTSWLQFFFPNPTQALIFTLKPYTRISFIPSHPGYKPIYCLSSGAEAIILSHNINQHTSLVKLPSGVRKIFSYYSLTNLGGVSFKEKRHLVNTKSGFWRSQGKSSLVRGVAMNPVDHPHGGRTNAIRYPRTPWGKTTKR